MLVDLCVTVSVDVNISSMDVCMGIFLLVNEFKCIQLQNTSIYYIHSLFIENCMAREIATNLRVKSFNSKLTSRSASWRTAFSDRVQFPSSMTVCRVWPMLGKTKNLQGGSYGYD